MTTNLCIDFQLDVLPSHVQSSNIARTVQQHARVSADVSTLQTKSV